MTGIGESARESMAGSCNIARPCAGPATRRARTMRLSHWAVAWLVVCSLGLLAGCGADQSQADNAFTTPPASQADDAGSQRDDDRLVSGLPDFTRLVKNVSPAVVNISAMPPKAEPGENVGPGGAPPSTPGPVPGQGPNPGDSGGPGHSKGLQDWLKQFFGDEPEQQPPAMPPQGEHVSLGSGFIVSSDGYILTNRHVVAGAGQIVVKLNDRRQLLARVVGADAASDVAVLKVDARHLPTVRIGDVNALDVGEWVVAIGSPFGFETSVTAGIVSAKDRNLADNQYVPFLQTDVAINPGNSGGPLFNLAGRVVGINSQIFSQTGGYQGVSFAIPIDVAMSAARQLRAQGRVVRGWLGVQIQNVDRRLAQSFDLARPVGALVTQIMKNSPAAHADIQVGDVILSLNGRPVDSAADLPPLVGMTKPGDKPTLTVLRHGDRKDVSVKIQALPARFTEQSNPAGPGEAPSPGDTPFGLSLAPLKAGERNELGLDKAGVRVTDVGRGPAARAGLRAGDIVLSVGSRDVTTPQALIGALKAADGTVALLVMRDGARRYLPMQTR